MMKHTLLLLSFVVLAPQAQGLKMIVKAQNLATLKNLGYGESHGSSNKFTVEFDKDFQGPVLVMFTQTTQEKEENIFPGLKNSYEGILRDGQLSIVADEKNLGDMFAEVTDKSIPPSDTGGSSSTYSNNPNPVLLDAPPSVTLRHFLKVFNLAMKRDTSGRLNMSTLIVQQPSRR